MQTNTSWYCVASWQKKLASSLTILALVLLSAGPLLVPTAANAVEAECSQVSQTIVSDTTAVASSTTAIGAAALVTPHSVWTSTVSMPGSNWIWDTEKSSPDDNGSHPAGTVTFTHTFTITGDPTGATLDITTDNSYVASINNNPVGSDGTWQSVESYSIPNTSLQTGLNTLTVVATNDGPDGAGNPAGLIYKLVANSEVCPEPEPEIVNSCPLPDALGDTATETINPAPESEKDLQEILDEESYSLNAVTDQKQFQVWNVTSGMEVTIDTAFVDKYAGHKSVFGYYTNGSLSNFVPVFRTADIVGTEYDSLPLSTAGPFTATVPDGATTIGFAIKTWNGNTPAGDVATQNLLNASSVDNVVVYNHASNKYVLGFEDLISGDDDYNDLVVDIELNCVSTSGGLIVKKIVSGSNASPTAFSFTVDKQGNGDPVQYQFESDGQNDITGLANGAYDVVEVAAPGYTTTYSSNRPGDNANDCENIPVNNQHTYTCTITNTLNPQCNANGSYTLYSDTTTEEGGQPSVAVPTPYHPAWTASIPSAVWIWGEHPMADYVATTTQTFTKDFTVVGTPLGATLDIAADNSYVVTVNGNPVGANAGEYNYSGVYSYSIPASSLLSGANVITFVVTNHRLEGGTEASNPAGLLYKLTVNQNECITPPPPVDSCVAGVNLLNNGDFETPAFTNSEHWAIFDSGISWLVNWVGPAVSGRPASAFLELQEDGISGGAWDHSTQPGSQWAELDTDWGGPGVGSPVSEPSAVTIHQVIPTTVGKTYKVDFQFSPRPGTASADNVVESWYGGALGLTVGPTAGGVNTNWTDHTYTFVATTTSTAVAFKSAGTPDDTYGAFLDNVSVSCVPQPPVVQTATVTLCKIDTSEHSLANWTLMLKGDHVEDLSVPVNTSAGISTGASLTGGMSYLAVAKGTWTNQGGANPVDAEYSTTDSWATQMDGYTGYGNGLLELEINQTDGAWGPYSSTHEYAQSFTPATSGSANFRVFDGDTGSHVQDEGWFPDNSGSLDVSVYEGYAGVTGENGCVTFTGVPYGTYTVDELMQPNWENESGLGELVVNAPTVTETVVNDDTTIIDQPENTATLSAVKIECDAEEYLPNWGNHATSSIDASTAAAFLAEGDNNEHCRLVPWTFEWSLDGVGNPGDETPVGGTGWNPFTSTTIAANTAFIPAGVKIWVREQFNTDYVGFTGQNTNQDVSAEIYCHADILNYDNWEWIDSPVAGNMYHCVAFNAPVDHGCLETEHWDSEAEQCVPNGGGNDGPTDTGPAPTARTLGGGVIGGGGGSILGASTGQILGASCSSKYLEKYLRMGKKNDPEQVKKLQIFLNKWENAGLPVTGFFGPMTFAAVMAFQQHYFEEVLKPWGVAAPTGIVYQTTQRWINLMECPDLDLTIPPLEEWKEGAEL